MSPFDIIIVGTGHGGAQTAMSLRQLGFEGSIALVGAERDLPYERPPLSKDYLAGEKPFERMLFRPADAWHKRQIQLVLGEAVTQVDVERRRVTLEGGRSIGFAKLVWSAGGRPRRLACTGHDLAGVHTIRTRADVDALRSELSTTSTAVVIGGGYIGLEAAAVLTKLGKRVVLLEALERLLARVAGEDVSRFYEQEHRAHGVDVRLSQVVECIEEAQGRAVSVRLASGETLPADLVVVGVGIVPAVEPLIAAGATGAVDGVLVDEYCRTSLAGVYAIGDCAAHRNRFAGDDVIRLESVQNATDQANVVAKAIVGSPQPYTALPWFWSDQYDVKLQTVGVSRGFDEHVVRGDSNNRSFSVVYLKQGRVVALDCINATREYAQGRKLVETKALVPREALADADTSLKSLLS